VAMTDPDLVVTMSRYTVTAERGTRTWVLQCQEFPAALSELVRLDQTSSAGHRVRSRRSGGERRVRTRSSRESDSRRAWIGLSESPRCGATDGSPIRWYASYDGCAPIGRLLLHQRAA